MIFWLAVALESSQSSAIYETIILLDKTKQGIYAQDKTDGAAVGRAFLFGAGWFAAGRLSISQPTCSCSPSASDNAARRRSRHTGARACRPNQTAAHRPHQSRRFGAVQGFRRKRLAPEQGFRDGETAVRSDLKIENTKTPSLYLTERYGMTSFTYPVLNGKYLVKLHFAETYEGITGPGQRVFSFNVQGHEFKDVDIWVKAGGPLRAYVESVPVEVSDGNVHITFTLNVDNPEINAIEIIPQP